MEPLDLDPAGADDSFPLELTTLYYGTGRRNKNKQTFENNVTVTSVLLDVPDRFLCRLLLSYMEFIIF